MHVGIDCRTIVGNMAGLGRYVNGLVDHLLLLNESGHDYTLYFHRGDPRLSKWQQQTKQFVLKAPLTNWWTHITLPLHLLHYPVDICHFPNFIAPILVNCKTIITIHDLNFLLFPKNFTLRTYIALASQVRMSANKADAIMVDSESTKADVMRLLRVPEEKLTVVYPGIHSRFQRITDVTVVNAVKHKYNLEDYILCVGSLAPQKNLNRLIRAFAKYKKQVNNNYKLAVVGGQAWKYSSIFDEIRQLNIEESIVFTGYVPDEDLPLLYSGATAFIYPSLYEGFGFPVLEAMACGVPTITSNVSSLLEVGGNAVLFIDPHNEESITNAIKRLLEDQVLRQSLIQAGAEQVQKFSFQRMAKEALQVYEKVMQQ